MGGRKLLGGKSRNGVSKTHGSVFLRAFVLGAVLISLLFGSVYLTSAKFRVAIWREVERADICDDYALSVLKQDKEAAAEFWLERLVDQSLDREAHDLTLAIVREISEPAFQAAAKKLAFKKHAHLFAETRVTRMRDEVEKYGSLLNDSGVDLKIKEQLSDAKQQLNDLNGELDEELGLRLFQLLQYTSGMDYTWTEWERFGLNEALKQSEPQIDCSQDSQGRSALLHFILSYGLTRGQAVKAKESSFGADLLLEFFEPAIRSEQMNSRSMLANEPLSCTFGKYFNWSYCYDLKEMRQHGRRPTWPAWSLGRMLAQSHWQQKHECLWAIEHFRDIDGSLRTDFDRIANGLLLNCQLNQISPQDFLQAVSVDDRAQIENVGWWWLRFENAEAMPKAAIHDVVMLDNELQLLLCLRKNSFDNYMQNMKTCVKAVKSADLAALDWPTLRSQRFAHSGLDGVGVTTQLALQQAARLSRKVCTTTQFGPLEMNADYGLVRLSGDNVYDSENETFFLIKTHLGRMQYIRGEFPGAENSTRTTNLTSEDLNRCLEILGPFERSLFIEKFVLENSNDKVTKLIRPVLRSQERKARLDTIIGRVQASALAAMQIAAKQAPFTDLSMAQKLARIEFALQNGRDTLSREMLRYQLKYSVELDYKLMSDTELRSAYPTYVEDAFGLPNGDPNIIWKLSIAKKANQGSYGSHGSHELVYESLAMAAKSIKFKTDLPWFLVMGRFRILKEDYPELLPLLCYFVRNKKEGVRVARNLMQWEPIRSESATTRDFVRVTLTGDWDEYWAEKRKLGKKAKIKYLTELAETLQKYTDYNDYLAKPQLSSKRIRPLFQLLADIRDSSPKATKRYPLDELSPFLSFGIQYECLTESNCPEFFQFMLDENDSDSSWDTYWLFSMVLSKRMSLEFVLARCKGKERVRQLCKLCHMLGPVARPALDKLVKQLNGSNERTVIAALLAITRVDLTAEVVLPKIKELIVDDSRSPRVRGAAICALRRFEGNPEVGQCLQQLIDSESLEPLLKDTARRSLHVWKYYQTPPRTVLDWKD